MTPSFTWRGLTLIICEDSVYRTPPDSPAPCRVYEGDSPDEGPTCWWASTTHGAVVLEVDGTTPESALDAALAAGIEYSADQVQRWTERLAALRELEGRK